MRWQSLALVVGILVASLFASVSPAQAAEDLVLPVPYRSQFDGTVWAASNCGPTSIAMVLEAYDQDVPTKTLRDRANQLYGIASPGTGTRIEDLARVVQERGLTTFGLMDGRAFHKWTLDDVRAEIEAGRPVVALVYYPSLPNHKGGAAVGHYIVIVGVEGDDFLFNDSATHNGSGYQVPITATQLTHAWQYSSHPMSGFSVGPAAGEPSLLSASVQDAPFKIGEHYLW
ncbi:MAG: C39 family peptidase [Chloroflexota bacterium]